MRWCELVTSIVPENEMDENSYVRCAHRYLMHYILSVYEL